MNTYLNQLTNHKTRATNKNPRVVLGSILLKHTLNLVDEETFQKIRENLYIQYFLHFDSFT